jgi:hypothetical protein
MRGTTSMQIEWQCDLLTNAEVRVSVELAHALITNLTICCKPQRKAVEYDRIGGKIVTGNGDEAFMPKGNKRVRP